ncbi:unnamed protein product [Rotaria socialis]|uniref:Uncharacterized protein n=1 Tax=Rotaria socialis TaxID=392032 RepID=A0A820DU25_9BILA|nr:unnamed protein product [Rotaria socialis]CAF3441133.1 unnamed protein product [Rotaria socialis]CAF3448339.1 unnamed protein product [Rotaria socialis]CAF3708803.1 unnamed protein product [Rotaria socialis]CAF4237614.1 unnamed protein product [Rotaria socialis]
MFHFYPIFILVLLFNLYCSSLTIPCTHHNKKDKLSLSDSNSQNAIKPLENNRNDQNSYADVFCTSYGVCSDTGERNILNGEEKSKPVMSSLFHGIPKFGKREFRSLFAGIPKFG